MLYKDSCFFIVNIFFGFIFIKLFVDLNLNIFDLLVSFVFNVNFWYFVFINILIVVFMVVLVYLVWLSLVVFDNVEFGSMIWISFVVCFFLL